MNILNVDDVESFCEGLAPLFADVPEGRRWATAQLRRHVMRTPSLCAPLDGPAAALVAIADGVAPPWLAVALGRGDAIAAFDPGSRAAAALADQVRAVADWARADPGGAAALGRMGFAEALAATRAWEAVEARGRVAAAARRMRVDARTAAAYLARRDPRVAALWPDDPDGVETLLDYPDGHRMVRLTSKASLEREGTLLDHCVLTYADRVASGGCAIMSLRDGSNFPLATIEVTPLAKVDFGANAFVVPYLSDLAGLVAQVRGLANAAPPPDVAELVALFTSGRGYAPMGWRLRPEAFVDADRMLADLDALVAADGTRPAMVPGPRARFALAAAARTGRPLTPDLAATVAAHLAPGASDVSVRDDVLAACGRTVVVREVTVPCGAFLPATRAAAAAAGHRAFLTGAEDACARVLDIVDREVTAVIRLVPSAGAPGAAHALFAAAGQHDRLASALARNAAAARAHVSATASAIRRAMPGATDGAERARLQNAMAVTLPALMVELAPRAAGVAQPAPAGRPRPQGRGLDRMRAAASPAPRP